MAYSDIAVIVVIVIFGVIGLAKGIIKMVYRLLSFAVSIFLAVKFSKPASVWLIGTGWLDGLRDKLMDTSWIDNITSNGIMSKNPDDLIKAFENIPVPQSVKEKLAELLPKYLGDIIDTSSLQSGIATQLIDLISLIICAVVIFIVIKIILSFVGRLVESISELPVIKQLDRTGGLIAGLVIGIAIVYIACAVVTLFNASAGMQPVFDDISSSKIASFFYEDNILMKWVVNQMDKLSIGL